MRNNRFSEKKKEFSLSISCFLESCLVFFICCCIFSTTDDGNDEHNGVVVIIERRFGIKEGKRIRAKEMRK